MIGQVLPVRIASLERYSLLGELVPGQGTSAALQKPHSELADTSETRMGA
jgi:hypothetical protein